MTKMETGRQATSHNLSNDKARGEVIKSRLWLFACYQMLLHLNRINLIKLCEEPETIKTKLGERKVIKYRIQPTMNLKYQLKLDKVNWLEKAFCLDNSMNEVTSVYESHGFRDMQMVFVNNMEKLSEDFKTPFDKLCISFEKDLLWLEKFAKEHQTKSAKSELAKSNRYFKVVITVFTVILKGYYLKLNEDEKFLEMLNEFFNKNIMYNKRLSNTTKVMEELCPLVSYVFTKTSSEFENLKSAFEGNAFDYNIVEDIIYDSDKMNKLQTEIYLKVNGQLKSLKLEDALIEVAIRMNNAKHEELVTLEVLEEHMPVLKEYTYEWDLNKIFLTDFDIKHLSVLQESKVITNPATFKKYIVHRPKLLLFFTSHLAVNSQFVTDKLYKSLLDVSNDTKKYNAYFAYIYSSLTRQIMMLRLAAIQKQFNIFSDSKSLIQLNEYNAFANYVKGGCYKLDLRIYNALRFGNFDSLVDIEFKNFLSALEANNTKLNSQSQRILKSSYNAFIAMKQQITDNL